MLRLWRSDDIDHPGPFQLRDPEPQRGEISRRVSEPAVALAHDHRQRLTVLALEARSEDAQRALIDPRQPVRLEVLGYPGQQRVVEALATYVVRGEPHSHPVVHRLQVPDRFVHELVPDRDGALVAALELDDPLPGPVGELGIAVEPGPGLRIQHIEILDGMRGLVVPALVQQMLDQHAELRAPVAQVVLADHPVAEELEDPGQSVPDHRRPEVPDVHLLGPVRARVVDDDGVGVRFLGNAEPFVSRGVGQRADDGIAL